MPILVTGESGVRPTFEKVGSDEARERAIVSPAVELMVRQFGCTHYAVEYTFVLKGEKTSVRSASGWLKRAAELLGAIRVTQAQREAVESIAETLRKAAAQRYAYGDQLHISDMETLSATVESAPEGTKLVVLYDVTL